MLQIKFLYVILLEVVITQKNWCMHFFSLLLSQHIIFWNVWVHLKVTKKKNISWEQPHKWISIKESVKKKRVFRVLTSSSLRVVTTASIIFLGLLTLETVSFPNEPANCTVNQTQSHRVLDHLNWSRPDLKAKLNCQ